MELRLRGRLLPDVPVIMANVACPEPVSPHGSGAVADLVRDAVADGALLADIGRPGISAIESVRAANPEVIICADAPGADITRDPAIAARTGAALLRGAARLTPAPGTATATAALIEAAPAEATALVAAGHAVLGDADAGELAATIAVASVLAWLGVRVIRTRHVAAVRQALEMVESIRGTRAPAWARRGLA